MTYYVEHKITDEEKRFTSLKKAVEYAVAEQDTENLIHNGWRNLVCYENGDTFETLYCRCKEMIKSWGL